MNTTSPSTHEWRFATDEAPSLHLRSHRGDVRLFHDAGPGEVLVRLNSLSAFDPQAVETRTQGRDVFVTVPPTLDPSGDTGFGFAFQVGRLSWGIGNVNRVDVEVHLAPDADVEVHAEGGDIVSTGRSARVQLQTGGGDIALDEATGGQVVTQGGDISVGGLDHGELRTGGGDIRVTRLGEGSVKTAGGDVRNLAADGQHRVAEAIQLGQVLAFGRFHHQGAGHRERHSGSVEAVVDESFGDVLDGDPGLLGDRPQIEQALVGNEALLTGVEQGECLPDPGSDVVGSENRVFRRTGESVAPHQTQVDPRDHEDAGTSPGGAGHRA